MKNDSEFKTLVVLWGGSCDSFHTFNSPMLNPAHPHKNLTLNKIRLGTMNQNPFWKRSLSYWKWNEREEWCSSILKEIKIYSNSIYCNCLFVINLSPLLILFSVYEEENDQWKCLGMRHSRFTIWFFFFFFICSCIFSGRGEYKVSWKYRERLEIQGLKNTSFQLQTFLNQR